MGYAVLFPGQGSQHVGMGEDLFGVHDELLGAAADEVLGWSLRKMCLDGPAEELTRTEHAQPALYALSYALWVSFREAAGNPPTFAAGHSLGEYTALAASGAIDYFQGLRLVAERGRLMAESADAEQTGMSALLGADREVADAVVSASRSAGGTLQLANLNAPGQIVVAGSVADLDWLDSNARELGVRRAIRLKVAGAFHSSYMEAASSGLAGVVKDVDFGSQDFDVVSNVDASVHVGDELAELLVRQVTSPVRFQESLETLAESGVGSYVHIGPGDVTAGLAKRTLPDANVFTVSSIEDIGPVVDALGDGTIDGQQR